MEGLVYNTLGKIILGFLAVLTLILIGFISYKVWEMNNCLEWKTTGSYFHAPTYIKSGNMLIPVGEGNYSDSVCVRFKR